MAGWPSCRWLERIEPTVAARLNAALDQGEVAMERDGLALRFPARIGLIAFDEGCSREERPPEALLERLAFLLDLNDVAMAAARTDDGDAAAVISARERLGTVAPADTDVVEAVCSAAEAFGLGSLRAPLLTLRGRARPCRAPWTRRDHRRGCGGGRLALSWGLAP